MHQVLDELLSRAAPVAQAAEVYAVEETDEPVQFEANRLKQLEQRQTSGVALRIVRNGRIGLASTSRLDNLDALVQMAVELSAFGPQARLQFPGPARYPEVPVYDPEVPALPVERLVELGQSAIDRIRRERQDLVCSAHLTRGVHTIYLANSRGASATYKKTSLSIFVEATLVQGTDMLFLWEGKSSCRADATTDDIVASIVGQLAIAQTLAPAPSGQVPVLFTPRGVGGVLLAPLLAGLEGRAVVQKSSPLLGRLHQQVFDPRFSLVDDPTYAYAAGARMCDDEGVPTRRLPLVDQGVLQSFLYDLQTAAEMGVESTGSAHRALGSLPSPGASAVLVAPGQTPYADLLAGMERGVVVERLLGAGQSNIIGGDFNANVLLGYAVERGRIIGRVKDTLISGNVYKALNAIGGISAEARWVGGFAHLPAILCHGGVSVATKA